MNIFGLMRFAIFFFATIAGASGDVFTPVIASTLSPETHAVRGTDKAYHIIYELQLTNTRSLPATIRRCAGGSECFEAHHQLLRPGRCQAHADSGAGAGGRRQ